MTMQRKGKKMTALEKLNEQMEVINANEEMEMQRQLTEEAKLYFLARIADALERIAEREDLNI